MHCFIAIITKVTKWLVEHAGADAHARDEVYNYFY
jgi:hypothetical protein